MDAPFAPVAVFLLVLLVVLLRRRQSARGVMAPTPPAAAEPPQSEPVLVAVPQSVARERAAALLPLTASRDARSLLVQPDVGQPAVPELAPDRASCWVLEVALRHPSMLSRNDLAEVFPREWMERHPCTLFGRSGGAWTFVFAGDAPALFDAIAIEVELVPHAEVTRAARSREELAELLDAVKQRLAAFGAAEVVTSMSVDDAAARAAALAELLGRCDRDVILVLRAPRWKDFPGREVWDVLLALGLEWGSLDLFHWQNETGVGDDAWFSVWTTTPPGYFLPEAIAANRLEVRDLVFGYSIPRSAAPVAMVDQLLAAVRWTQLRLGGEATFFDYALDESMLRDYVTAIDAELRAAGFPPGRDAALRFF